MTTTSIPSTTSTPSRVGFVGLGTMGAPMAANVARAGFPLSVWNRTPSRADALVALGARRCATLGELARTSDVVVICVSDAPEVDEVLFAGGLAEGLAPGSVVVDCSTISPVEEVRFAVALAERSVGLVDAPVTGGSEGAARGTLTILVGGDQRDVEVARPVLEAMGTSITHLGPVGRGQWAKAINQVILAGTYLAVAEGVTLALRADLDATAILEALRAGAAGSWVLENRGARMIEDDYPLGFKISLHRKDLAIALDLARGAGAALPVTALAAAFEDGLIHQGHGDDDIAALARPIRRLSGL